VYAKRCAETHFQTKDSVLGISTTLSGVISHARLFLLASCGTLGRCLWNPGSLV